MSKGIIPENLIGLDFHMPIYNAALQHYKCMDVVMDSGAKNSQFKSYKLTFQSIHHGYNIPDALRLTFDFNMNRVEIQLFEISKTSKFPVPFEMTLLHKNYVPIDLVSTLSKLRTTIHKMIVNLS